MARELSVVFDVMDRRWEWGASDCCTAACDVFKALHGIDPMASLRGKYKSQLGAAKIIAGFGGFVAMCEKLAFDANLSESSGEAGDIGVAEMNDGVTALVICIAPNSWVGKTEGGFATVDRVLRSWSCHQS